ncbi:MAG: Asp23/Gls24 family envelope stress response protein [Tissierellia bacterium]|jgi:uncharacterized alkaline shock family protein YloU|nr:Asp23/Gls24 family envelope stress response protein [Bacillota bacterium]NLK58018.1 Asp23/Gls24 family envelope stress response protein [Tissierellia bacterium]
MDNTFTGGRVKIANTIIEKVVREAAMEVTGVAELLPGHDFVSYDKFTTTDTMKGVKIATKDGQVRIDLRLIAHNAEDLTKIAESAQRNITEKLHVITGLRAVEVNVFIEGLKG